MTVEDVWYGTGVRHRVARAALAPLSLLYGCGVRLRNSLYDRGLLPTSAGGVPVVSIGNITVGGTGKTPFAAHVVRLLTEMGHHPAIVMRGYGDDEKHLHARLNPGLRVYATADRVSGIARARGDGADVVVLDDAFQHRGAARSLDIVLVSADQWRDHLRVLPAGPLREPEMALRRADLVVVTRKHVTRAVATRVAARVAEVAPGVTVVTADLAPGDLVDALDETAMMSVSALAGADVMAVAGIGDPASFVGQLRGLGANVTARLFADHHDYTPREVAALASEGAGHKYVVTTQKDAVKLTRSWPAKGQRLLYLSQAVKVADESVIREALRDILSH